MGRRFLFILLIAVFAPEVIYADATPADPTVRLVVGRSTVVDVGNPIARVSLTSADIADAMVTAPNQLLINGKAPGTISMFVWDRGGALRRYEVTVQRDVAKLAEQVRQLFPNERIAVESNGRGVVLSGSVSTKDIAEKAVNLASGYVDKKEEVVTLLQIAEGGASNQVLLRVRFAEVSRNALTELGASWFTGANGYKDWTGRATTQQFPAPTFDSDGTTNKLVFSDFLNLFLFNSKYQIGTVIKALQTRGLFQSLAEPNLVAESGKEASFLAGGEFPIPIAQPSGGGTSITVQFKEFGIRLNFTPTVNGNRVHLKVRPEVSSLDFNNAITLNGFRIPALTTRRTETELELNDHQTFAIAGLINNTMLQTMQKVPGIGDIPIIGLLFRSKAAQKDQTELVVMITPEILRQNSVGVTNELPRAPESFLPTLPEKKAVPMPSPAFVPPDGELSPKPPTTRSGEDSAEIHDRPAAAPAVGKPAPEDPAAAAATLSNLMPRGPQVVKPQPAPAKPQAPTSPAAAPQPSQNVSTPAASNAKTATPGAPVTRPLTADEKKVLERARAQEEKQRRAEEQAKAAEGQRIAKQLEADRKAAAEQKVRDDKAAAEQKVRDDKAAKEQARKDAEAVKRAVEEAKKEAERDRKQQQVIEEAAAKLKAAEAAYQAELAKKQPK